MVTATEDAAKLNVPDQLDLTYAYYRQPNGWITVSPGTELEELWYRKEGWEPLPEYGRLEMGNEYAANHPLERLFMLGGAKELPVDQIIKMGLHLNSPLVPVCERRLDQHHKRHAAACWVGAKPVEFPQLKNPPKALECRFCDRNNLPTEQARDQHEGVAHKEEKGEIRMGETLAGSLVEGLREGQTPVPSIHPYICGACSAGFDESGPFLKHVEEERDAIKTT